MVPEKNEGGYVMDEIFQKNYSLLITNVKVNGNPADIFIDETGVIRDIGENIRKVHKGKAEFIIDADGAIALPGLVNTHTHSAMTLLRGYADDMFLHDWLSQKIWPLEAKLTGDDVYWGTKLACLEMIKSGTTAFNDMYFFMEDTARAVNEMGIRAVLSHGFIDLANPDKRELECKATEKLVNHIRSLNNPKIRSAVGPHAPYTVSKEGLSWCAECAAEHKIGIHIHVSETEKEVNDCLSQHGKGPVAVLDECGILTPRTVAAHCCWLDEAECQLFGKRGVSASHNPVSNMKLATHRAMPYHWLKAANTNISLGTDGCSSNNNLDMFEEMKTASLIQKFFWNDPTLLTAPEALHMATLAGARALGLPTGILAVGSPADIVLVTTRSSENVPMHNPISNIVYSCNGASVETVLCDGKVLMLEREVQGEQEILTGAGKVAFDLVNRANQS
jgi:5-methylthioadenosine/S-adenosylhomocysteine deaminase